MRSVLFSLILVATGSTCQAQFGEFISLKKFNQRHYGHVVDYSDNHHQDNRIYSRILQMKRDLYVYLPPGYTPTRAYPLAMWLHGSFGDEHALLDSAELSDLDEAIARGWIPPMIVVCPDGTVRGRNCVLEPHSFYANGVHGRFEDHVLCEILPFVCSRYSVCSDRRHRALIGHSAGGYAALGMALKHRDQFGVVAALAAPINLRYGNVNDDPFEDFSPQTYRWRSDYDPGQTIGEFCHGLVKLPAKWFVGPVFGRNPNVVPRVQARNPADLIFTTNLQPGELDILIGYGGRDNFNFDAHAKSWLWLARQRGISADVYYDPDGKHSYSFFCDAQKTTWKWIGRRFAAVDCTTHEMTNCPLDAMPEEPVIPPVPEAVTEPL